MNGVVLFQILLIVVALLIGGYNVFYVYRVRKAQGQFKMNLPKPLHHLLRFSTLFPFGAASVITVLALFSVFFH